MLHDVVAQIVPHPVGVPVGRREQPLHTVRARLASLLSQGPTVLTLQRRQQATQMGRHPLTRLRPREPRRDPRMHLIQARRPGRHFRHPNMSSHRTQDAQQTIHRQATRRPRSD